MSAAGDAAVRERVHRLLRQPHGHPDRRRPRVRAAVLRDLRARPRSPASSTSSSTSRARWPSSRPSRRRWRRSSASRRPRSEEPPTARARRGAGAAGGHAHRAGRRAARRRPRSCSTRPTPRSATSDLVTYAEKTERGPGAGRPGRAADRGRRATRRRTRRPPRRPRTAPPPDRPAAWQDAAMVDLQRRALIAGAAATVAALRLGASALAAPAVRRAPLPADPFTLGVASGDPAADGFVLWTRLAPDPLNGGGMPPDPVAVTWEVASDPLFATVEASGSLNAVADLAHTRPRRGRRPRSRTRPTGTGSRWRAGSAPSVAPTRSPSGIARRAAVRVRVVPELRQRLLPRAGRAGHGGVRPVAAPGRLHLRERRWRPDPLPRSRRVRHARRSTEHRYALYKTDPDLQAAHHAAPVRARVGRPRGRQQLHRRGRRPPDGRLPRLVRAPAGAPERARRPEPADLPTPRMGRPGRAST